MKDKNLQIYHGTLNKKVQYSNKTTIKTSHGPVLTLCVF